MSFPCSRLQTESEIALFYYLLGDSALGQRKHGQVQIKIGGGTLLIYPHILSVAVGQNVTYCPFGAGNVY